MYDYSRWKTVFRYKNLPHIFQLSFLAGQTVRSHNSQNPFYKLFQVQCCYRIKAAPAQRPLSLGFSVATPRVSLKKAKHCTFILVSRTLTHLTSFGTFTWHLNQQNKLQKWSDFIVQPNISTRSLAASDFSVKRQKIKMAWRDREEN